MDVSVVVPLYNEEDSVELMYSAINNAIASELPDHEIIFVDDGSSDDTFHLAKQLAADDPRLRVLKFRRNYGQTPAMAAGIDHARGDIIVTMDGDAPHGGEVHPDGDEIIYVISGRLQIIGDSSKSEP